MKVYKKLLLWPLLFAGCMAIGTAGHAQCHRVYIRMTADYSFYQRHGSSTNTTRQVMRNTLTNAVLDLYQDLGIEFVLLPSVVRTNPNTDPFRDIPTEYADLAFVQQTLSEEFAPTTGGYWSYSPFHTPSTPGFTYELNILFIYKHVVDQYGNDVNGAVTEIGNLYSNDAHLFISQADMVPEMMTVQTPQGPVTIPTGQEFIEDLDQSQFVRGLAHEIGHALGARHDNEFSPNPCGAGSGPLMCATMFPGNLSQFSSNSLSAINNNLATKHFDGSQPSVTFSQNQTWTLPRAYNSIARFDIADREFLAKNGPVFLRSKEAVKITGTTKFAAQSNDAIVFVVDPNMYDCATKNSGGGLRISTAEEEQEFLPVIEPVAGESQSAVSVAPNPFLGTASLRFRLDKPGRVNARILNPLGQLLSEPVADQEFTEGQHEVQLDMTGQNSGVYYILFSSDLESSTIRAVLK